MTRCSTLLLFRGMLIKTTVRYHQTPLKWLKLKRLEIPKVGKDVQQLERSYIPDRSITFFRHFGKLCFFLIKLKLILRPSIFTFNYLPERSEHKDLYMNVQAALFIRASKWKLPKCPSTGKWINKMWYIRTMKYHSLIKNLLMYITICMALKGMMLKEARHKGTCYMIPLT